MANRGPLPIPAAKLQELMKELDEEYGFKQVRSATSKLLLVRVPFATLDLVRDIQKTADRLRRSDIEGCTSVLLFNGQRLEMMGIYELQAILQERDRQEVQDVQQLRKDLQAHHSVIYEASWDPRRVTRVAYRVPGASVRDITRDDENRIARALGPKIENGELDDAVGVFLIASEDHVRLEVEQFVREVLERHAYLKEQERIEEQAHLAQLRKEREEVQVRSRAMEARESRESGFDPNTPRRSPEIEELLHKASRVARETRDLHAEIHEVEPARPRNRRAFAEEDLEADLKPRPRSRFLEEGLSSVPRPRSSTPAATAPRLNPRVEEASKILHSQGFSVRPLPADAAAAADIAASRKDGYPKRVLVKFFDQCNLDAFEAWLDEASELGGDTWYALGPGWPAGTLIRSLGHPVKLLRLDELDRIGS